MTSTGINVGFNDARNSSKVLKPPGGGSSDIFGTANGSTSPLSTPRSKNHMASNIFGAPQSRNGEVRRTATADSHNRLFGEVNRIQANGKAHPKSNIPFGNGDAIDAPLTNGSAKASLTNGNGIASIVHAENGNGHHHQHTNGNGPNNGREVHLNGNGTKHDGGNPVTGQGYASNGTSSSAATSNGGAPTLNGSKQVINKNRIPPGGFSSGLW